MAAAFGEEFGVGDGDCQATAEAGADEFLGEGGGIVGVGVAGWCVGHGEGDGGGCEGDALCLIRGMEGSARAEWLR